MMTWKYRLEFDQFSLVLETICLTSYLGRQVILANLFPPGLVHALISGKVVSYPGNKQHISSINSPKWESPSFHDIS